MNDSHLKAHARIAALPPTSVDVFVGTCFFLLLSSIQRAARFKLQPFLNGSDRQERRVRLNDKNLGGTKEEVEDE